MPAQLNQLITVQILKDYMKWDPLDATNDEFFNFMVNALSDCLENFCNTKLKLSSVTEIVCGSGSSRLRLSNLPVREITAMKKWTGNLFEDLFSDTSALQASLYCEGNMLYSRDWYFEEGTYNFQITYSCGYSPIPADLELLCCELCTIAFNNSGRGESRIGLISNQVNNYKMFFLQQLPMHSAVLAKYRLINI